MAPSPSRVSERAQAVLDGKPGTWFCVQCWREAMSGVPEEDIYLSALARSTLRTLHSVYEVDTSGKCDVLGRECQTRNEAMYKYGGRALAARRRPES